MRSRGVHHLPNDVASGGEEVVGDGKASVGDKVGETHCESRMINIRRDGYM